MVVFGALKRVSPPTARLWKTLPAHVEELRAVRREQEAMNMNIGRSQPGSRRSQLRERRQQRLFETLLLERLFPNATTRISRRNRLLHVMHEILDAIIVEAQHLEQAGPQDLRQYFQRIQEKSAEQKAKGSNGCFRTRMSWLAMVVAGVLIHR